MSSVFPSPPSPPPSVVIEGVEVLDGAAVGRHGQVADNGKEDDQGNSHKNVGEHLCENLQENMIDSKKALLLLGSLWLSNHWSFKENLLIRKIT